MLFLLLFTVTSALGINGDTVTIYDATDFIELSRNVNNGIETYAGSTVVLGADIDFTNYSSQFEPIGIDQNTYFRGNFDGRGHIISNLNMVSPRQHISLFGVVNTTNIKNVVVDASCSFTSTYNFSVYYDGYAAGIVAYAFPVMRKAMTIIENCVNMANVAFVGDYTTKQSYETLNTIYVGGIVGFILPDVANTVIRNCVNYGVITVSGHCDYATIGGILSAFYNQIFSSKTTCSVINCANFGNLNYAAMTGSMLGLGGLAGMVLYGTFENNMIFSISKSSMEAIGSGKVVGLVSGNVTVKDCYWTSEEDTSKVWGFEYGTPTGLNNKLVEANEETLNALNEWVENNANEDGSNNYSRWMMLHLNGGCMGSKNANTNTFFTLNGLPIADPTKEGHDFTYWCLDSECVDGPATKKDVLSETTTELYAMWRINNYTATFNLNNKVYAVLVFTYNETIVPPDMTGVKKFHGWNLTYERMPGFNIVVVPNDPPDKEIKGGANSGAIAGGVIGGVAGVAIVVLIILFIVLQKTRKEEKEIKMAKMNKTMNKKKSANAPSRIVDNRERKGRFGIGMSISSGVEENSSEFLSLYPKDYPTPSISEALMKAGLSKNDAERAENDCADVAKRAESEGALPPAFTLDDAAAVALYTYDFGPEHFEINPYMLLNKALESGNSADVQRVRGLLYVVMCALRKLPRYDGKMLYRGLKMGIDKSEYANGKVIVWHGFISTSTDIKTVKSLLGSSTEVEKSTGTLFVIEGGWGYNVQPYSMFPDEEEILLEPNRQFVVSSVIGSDVTVVNLKMLDTPLVLPEVFGGENK